MRKEEKNGMNKNKYNELNNVRTLNDRKGDKKEYEKERRDRRGLQKQLKIKRRCRTNGAERKQGKGGVKIRTHTDKK